MFQLSFWRRATDLDHVPYIVLLAAHAAYGRVAGPKVLRKATPLKYRLLSVNRQFVTSDGPGFGKSLP